MTIGTTDIFLLVIIVSTLVVGFFWGAVRSLMLFAAWIIAFLAGAYLQTELGAYLARQWDNFEPAFSQMAAFALIYLAILIAAPVVIFVVTRSSQRVTRWQVLDDLTRDRLLEEERFVESFVRGRIRKGQGPVRIRGELAQRGIEDASVSSALMEADCDWVALAAEVRAKRFGRAAPGDFKERARQAKFLQYRGFESEQIRSALDVACDSD